MSLSREVLLVGICDFGWGSMGKLRLILDKLPRIQVCLFGDTSINPIIRELLGDRYDFIDRVERPNIALVINDPTMANDIAHQDVPVIYVDSLPYLWMTPDELPLLESIACYCAQSFPNKRLPVALPLQSWPQIRWIDPIMPPRKRHRGGQGAVINLGGLHSHLAGNSVSAYLSLVLAPLIESLKKDGMLIAGVCGNLPQAMIDHLRKHLPDCAAIGRLSPYDFQDLLHNADLLITSPGSTTILQALALDLPTLLLPPQNLSQILNAKLFSKPGTILMIWPECVMTSFEIEHRRTKGEDAVLSYIYGSISKAAGDASARAEVKDMISTVVKERPSEGNLDSSVMENGTDGAAQVARLIRQALFAPLSRPSLAEKALEKYVD